MLRWLLTICILLPTCMHAQEVRMDAGKVLFDSKPYAFYEAVGEKKPNLINRPMGTYEANPEVNPGGFKDYIFSTLNGEQVIFATAKVVSSPYVGLKYFYRIYFSNSDEVLNIKFHPLTIECLARDMVKYKVLNADGQPDGEAIARLAKIWRRNKVAIDDAALRTGSVRYYNNSPYHLDEKASFITVRDHSLYCKDSLIGNYVLSKNTSTSLQGSSKENFFYYISYPDGKPMADVQFQPYFSTINVWPAPSKEPIRIYTAERGEEGIIKAAATFLVNRKQALAKQ